jgi:hypothetical protein
VTVVNIFCLKEVHTIRLPTLLPYAQLVQTLLYPRSRRLTVGLLIIEAWHLRTLVMSVRSQTTSLSLWHASFICANISSSKPPPIPIATGRSL